jgi:ATP-dependent DNA helicase UvrD/PcrA
MTATFSPSAEQLRVISHRGGSLAGRCLCWGGEDRGHLAARIHADRGGRRAGTDRRLHFTERAAESLKNRIVRRVAEAKGRASLDRLGSMFVGTIHAYCLRLLQDHVPEFGNFDILDENRLAGLLSREHKRLELNKVGMHHWRPIFDFLRTRSE